MPWNKSSFYAESKGFPTMGVLRFCLSIKITHAFVSVICQMKYLISTSNVHNPTTSAVAKFLFIANISFSFCTVLLLVVTFIIKNKVLQERAVDDGEEKLRKSQRASAFVDVASIYNGAQELDEHCENSEEGHRSGLEGGGLANITNPLHHLNQPSISDSSIGASVITEPQTEDSQTDTQPSVPSPSQSL